MMNPFDAFKALTPITSKIEALDGAEITYRKLTMKESDDFSERIVKGYDSDGKPELNMDQLSDITYEKIALCMIEPKMTVEELKELSVDAAPAITEIAKLIEKKKQDVDDEGNQKD